MSKTPPRKKDASRSKEKGVSCPICGRAGYKDGKSVAIHISRKHPDAKDLASMKEKIKSATKAPLKLCPHCKKLRTNLARHLKVCPRRPRQEPGEGDMSNENFLQAYRDRISHPGFGIVPNTVKSYTGYIKRMIETEREDRDDFLAWNWLADPRSGRFRPLRPSNDYIRYGKSGHGVSIFYGPN